MIRALDNGYGMCSFMHNLISLLIAASRPGLRALDESRPNAPGAAVSLGSIAGPARAWPRDPAHRREIVREIREQFGSAAGTGK
jgi:hypothetical protein